MCADWPSARILPEVQDVAYRAARTRLCRADPGHGQVELVGGIAAMSMSDPLGDMLTRIRNGQRARQAVIASPASKFRANVLEVLKREGYIRGVTREHVRQGGAELKIGLKYVEGGPVIRTT